MQQPSIVILGSFRKHFDGIRAAARELEAAGVRVLSPGPGSPVNPDADFVLLDTDQDVSPRAVADHVMALIDQADAVLFHNPGGYLGPSAAFELGYCVARGKRIFVAEPPQDSFHALYAGRVAIAHEIGQELFTLHTV